jgi:ParB-like chromosome segregation protein Spo0J
MNHIVPSLSQLRPLSVSYRAIDALTPDPRNARTHPRKQIAQIAASIREFGFTNPILIDPEGHLIAGHGRLLAAKELGRKLINRVELPPLA